MTGNTEETGMDEQEKERHLSFLSYVATMRLRDRMADDRNFECMGCLRVLLIKKFAAMGAYIPKDKVMTVEGYKNRVAAYPLCSDCARKVGTRELATMAERNLTTKGVFMDSEHKKFEMPSEADFRRWIKEYGEEMPPSP